MTPEEGYQEALRRIEQVKRTSDTAIVLSDLELKEIPILLKNLKHLVSLDLNRNRISRIENLPPNLQSLIISDDQVKWDGNIQRQHSQIVPENQVGRIEGIPVSLEALKLDRTQISQIEGLHEGLLSLEINSSHISQIERLPSSLISLSLFSNKISQIEGLPEGLQSLILQNNKINRIECLPESLQHLNLQGNEINKIEELPKGLKSLHLGSNRISHIENLPVGLKSLNLWENPIGRIINLPFGLQSLNLWHTRIEKIEELPAGLKIIDLQYNQIHQIENIPAGLSELYLQHNKITQVDRLPTTLTKLYLFGNPIRNIPPEILGKETWDDCLDNVTAWFADLEQGSIINRTIRLMITGNGNVGKSSVIEALQKGRCETAYDSTHGIHIKTLRVPDEPEPLTMQVFDFGGQEIYSGTHRIFLRGRAVQLIVFDTVTEAINVIHDRITNELVRNQPLQTWLHTVRQSSPDSSFLLLQNKIDVAEPLSGSIKAFLEQQESKGVTVTKISAVQGRYVDALRGYLLEAARALPEWGMAMPRSWHSVRQYFLDNLNQPLQQRTRLISRYEFNNRCRDTGVLPQSTPALLRYLHNSGAVYYDETYLGDTIITDQEWAIEAIYKVLDRESDLYQLLSKMSFGKCRAKVLFEAFGPDYSFPNRWLFIELMESCGLCFPLKVENYDRANLDTYYIFPEFLPTDVPEGVAYFLRDTTQPQRELRQQLTYLPYAHVQQFITRWGIKADIRDVWRSGLRIVTETGRFTFSADLQQHTITIHTEWSLSNEWFNDLLREATYEGATWQEIIPTAPPQSVPLSTDSSQTNLRDTLKDVVQPGVQQLVVSYARQDERFVEILRKKVAAIPTVTLWYDRKLSSRTGWSEEIETHFREADGFVIFLSDDYIDADNKSFIHEEELPIIQQRFRVEDELPVIIIRVALCNAEYIPLLQEYLMFDKGATMPCPKKKADKASAFMQKFVDTWVMKQFI